MSIDHENGTDPRTPIYNALYAAQYSEDEGTVRRIPVLARVVLVVLAVLAVCAVGAAYFSGEPEHETGHRIVSSEFLPYLSPDVSRVLGDDNLDGIIDEDESGWHCATMGNRICGDDNR